MKSLFIIHLDSLNVLDDLTDVQISNLFRAIRAYHLGCKIELDSITKVAFSPFKNQFDRDAVKYESICNRNKINGVKGGRPKTQSNPNNPNGYSETQSNPNNLDSDSDIDPVPEKDKKKKKKKLPADLSAKNPYHFILKKIFLEETPEYYFQGKDGKALNELTDKILFRLNQASMEITEEVIADSFRAVMARGHADKFVNNNFSLTMLNSKFNEITISPTSRHDRVIREFAERNGL